VLFRCSGSGVRGMFGGCLLLAVISARGQVPSGTQTAPLDRTFQAAMAAEDRGDMQQAQALLTGLHAAHPGIFAVDESLGLIFASRGDLAHALPLLEAAVREQPSSDAAHANLGAAFYGLHRKQRALDEFEEAVRIDPGNFSAQQSLGRLWMDRNKPNEAANAFLAALRLKPDDSDLAMDCATALLAANRAGEAGQILLGTTGVDKSARAQSLLGQVDEKEGKFEDAAKRLALAAELDPSEENAWMMGLELLRHWNFNAAEIEFAAAAAKFPDSRRLRIGLGAADFGDAKYPAAVEVFADLLEKDPLNAADAQLLGISCNAITQSENSRCGVLLKYVQSHPADAIAAADAASWLLDHNRDRQSLELAAKLLRPAIAAHPNLPEAQLQMGTILQDELDWKGSIVYLERAVKLKPELAEAHYRLARAYWETGRKQEGDAQMALQRKYAQKNGAKLDQRLRQVTSLAVSIHR
jgi:predicted Zn-dependent protease